MVSLSLFCLFLSIGFSFLFGAVGSIDSKAWPYMISTVVIHGIYFVSLGKSYKYDDLSSVYPIARGIGLAGIPILASIFTDDIVSIQGFVGISLVFTGVMTVAVFDKLNVYFKGFFSFFDVKVN